MNLYISLSTGRKNYHHYEPGFFYTDYFINSGEIQSRKIFAQRTRSVEEEEQYLISLFNSIDVNRVSIMHNHVAPMNMDIRDRLLNYPNSKNIFIHRRDKRAQLASYAIAMATRQFAIFNKSLLSDSVVPDIDPTSLYNLIDRIKVWDSLEKQNIIAYEDINFTDINGAPLKQTRDYKLRLSENMLSIIDTIVSEYENN